ncbi:unnamed protein product [Phytophthora lilii]|uniref:Unnamed protein product n=1 Tax=Phytophthora lilii TaxID=2077276 RepID=A0A9W6WLW9_9STRA|nr:unnamed protein product [Phytophthora lilii]
MEAGAESSEHVIAVLGPRLEQLGRLAVGLQVAGQFVEIGVCCRKVIAPRDFRQENAEVLAKTAFGESDSLRVELRRSKETQAQLAQKVEQLNAVVATHNEVYAKLAKRVQAAEDYAQRFPSSWCESKRCIRPQWRLIPPSVRVATVAWLIRMSPMIRRLLVYAFATRISWSGQRLVKANQTLRARVQLEEMDPDVLVLVSEGALILLVFLSFLVVNSQSIVMSSSFHRRVGLGSSGCQ